MNVIVCLCDRGGMLFNNRRQSRDRLLIKDLSEYCENGIVYISEFSAPLFEGGDISAIVASNPLELAGEGEYVFIENISLCGYEEKIEKMIVYKWNRSYPADFYLDVTPWGLGLTLTESTDFVGNSHEKITREVYSR